MFEVIRRILGNHELKFAIAGGTDPGKQREHNEDAFAISAKHRCAVVADGMGGLARGEVASRMAVDTVMEAMVAGKSSAEGLSIAHQRIRDASLAAGQERMGSTCVVLGIERDKATIRWVGDSRGYLWRGGALSLLTKDHSFVNELIAAGAITVEEAESHPNRHVLTRAVGIREAMDLRVDTVVQPLRPRDRLLLCSDGLHGYLPQSSLIECLRSATDASAVVRQLIERTLDETGADDNITAVCIAVED
ncbi:MAG: PP2C family protein-serine/threonine phosphatase [Panacagrimonas sp.]